MEVLVLKLVLSRISALKSKLLYYMIGFFSFILLIVYSVNSGMLNKDYSILSFVNSPTEYGIALISGVFLIIGLCLLIVGCLWKWLDILTYSANAVDYIDGAIRTVIAIGAGITCYASLNVVTALIIGMIGVYIIIKLLLSL